MERLEEREEERENSEKAEGQKILSDRGNKKYDTKR